MTRRSYYTILSLAAILLLSGCKKYLTVQPEDKFTEDQLYGSEQGIQLALNGLYTSLSDNALYGANLSTTTIELLGQRYNVSYSGSSNSYQSVQTFAYTQAAVQSTFDALWQKAYGTLLATNKFISEMDGVARKGILTEAHASQLKGEAIGIRALIHFDLLRLFGPVYVSAPTAPAIPYYTQADGVAQPILPAQQVLDSVLTDLSNAANLLSNDPVITSGVLLNPDYYSGYRNQRLNYYAVQGLMARAYLYGGNTTAAHDAALALLTGGEKWFPWLRSSSITDGTSPDRIFSSEVLFSVYNQNLYTNYNSFFSPALLPQSLLTALPARLDNIFEANQNDYRYTTTWLNSATGARTFAKYADIGVPAAPWRFLQPLLRKSEMYYILAETDTVKDTQLGYLDTVRVHRNLPNLATTVTIATEVKKEYQKEFFGEGQIFFYYKRTRSGTIPSGVSTGNITPNYVVPLPLSETTPR